MFCVVKICAKTAEMLKDVIHDSVNSISVFSLYRNISKKNVVFQGGNIKQGIFVISSKTSQNNCPYFFHRSVMYILLCFCSPDPTTNYEFEVFTMFWANNYTLPE